MDKLLLSSSLPKPSCIKEEEIGELSDLSVDDEIESSPSSEVSPSQSCSSAKKHISFASQTEEMTCDSSSVSFPFFSFCLLVPFLCLH